MNGLNRTRQILWVAGGLMGLVALVRMFVGPYRIFGIPVNVPLNPEGVFGLAMTILLAWRAKGEGTATARSRVALAALGAALVSVVAQAQVLNLYFLSDDFVLIRQANQWTWANLVPLFTTGGGDGFFRPVGMLSLAVNAAWAGTDPRWWHLSAMALHTANVILVTWLAARLGMSASAAFFAGALFALHGTHPEAAAWIAGRFDLLAVFFTLAGMLLFLEDRRWARIAALGCCLCSVFSKEAAFVFPVLLALLAWLRRSPLRATAPFFAATALAFAYRWILLGGIGGYISAETGRPEFLTLGLAAKAKAVLVRVWMSLYFPVNWSQEPSPLLAAFALAMLAALLWMSLRSRPSRTVWFALGALLISILPPLHLLGIAANLSGSRLLYLPSVWFCLLLASALESVPGRTAQILCASAILLFHGTTLLHNLDTWQAASREVRQTCAAAAEGAVPEAVPGDIRGVPALANGFEECVALAKGNLARPNAR